MAGGKYHYVTGQAKAIRPAGKPKGSAKTVAAPKRKHVKKTVKSVEMRLSKLEKQRELHYVTKSAIADPNVSTLSAFPLNLVSVGDDFNNRTGDQIVAKWLHWKCIINHALGANPEIVRIMMVWDKTNGGNATFPISTSTSNLEVGFLDDSSINVFQAFPNERTMDRYSVLYDQYHILNPDSTGTVKAKEIVHSINLHDAIVKYGATGSAITDISGRALFAIAIYKPTGSFNPSSNLNFFTKFMYLP